MFRKPELKLMERLHQTGRQLAVLRRMYQSYALIIKRILEKQRPLQNLIITDNTDTPAAISSQTYEAKAERVLNAERVSLQGHMASTGHGLGAPLSQAAIVRFERLLDRINLYALSEIQECLDEKNDLVFLVSVG